MRIALRTFSRVSAGVALMALSAFTGCVGYDYPDTAPGKDAVFNAAREVLRERYPMSSSSERSRLVYALTPVGLEGNSKSRKQIAVTVWRNFTGAYEPRVSVTQYVEWTEPSIGRGNPGSDSPSESVVIGSPRWRPLQRLPLEEHAIYEAIMGKLASAAGISFESAGI